MRLTLSTGFDPLMAICMATINAATCYDLKDRGAISPGLRADLIMFKDFENFKVDNVWIGGKLVASPDGYLAKDEHVKPMKVSGKMNVKNFSAERLRLPLMNNTVRTIQVLPHSVVTDEGRAEVSISNGCWVRDGQDIVKIAVVERHHGTGNVGVALLSGFGLKGGAIATSVAHDSHNIIVAGDNDSDMELAVNCLVKMGGGVAVVKDGKVLDSLEHEIAGLMTDKSGVTIAKRLAEMEELARKELGIHDYADPFMTLCFMALPVIPAVKVTDMGLFDVFRFCFTPTEVTE
jgi:adenine deaminase